MTLPSKKERGGRHRMDRLVFIVGISSLGITEGYTWGRRYRDYKLESWSQENKSNGNENEMVRKLVSFGIVIVIRKQN
jgi:hypothetical protein